MAISLNCFIIMLVFRLFIGNLPMNIHVHDLRRTIPWATRVDMGFSQKAKRTRLVRFQISDFIKSVIFSRRKVSPLRPLDFVQETNIEQEIQYIQIT